MCKHLENIVRTDGEQSKQFEVKKSTRSLFLVCYLRAYSTNKRSVAMMTSNFCYL